MADTSPFGNLSSKDVIGEGGLRGIFIYWFAAGGRAMVWETHEELGKRERYFWDLVENGLDVISV